MKILHVTRDFPPRFAGGISTAVGGLADALAAAGLSISVISFDGYRPTVRSPSPGPPAIEARGKMSVLRIEHPAQLEDGRAWAKEQRPDLCHCHHDLLWDFAGSVTAARVVMSAHVLQRAQNRLRGVTDATLSSEAQDRAVAGAHRIFAPSESARAQLAADYPAHAAKIAVVPFGLRARALPPSERAGAVFAGRFADLKGLATVCSAMASGRLEGVTLRVVGGCPESPRAQRRWRTELTNAAEVGHTALELSGWLSTSRTYQHLANAQVALVPSWIETFGLACAEAMQAGCAVLASDIPAVRELIQGGINGELFESRNATAMTDALLPLLADPARCRALGSAARDTILSQWTWEHRIEGWLEAYRALC